MLIVKLRGWFEKKRVYSLRECDINVKNLTAKIIYIKLNYEVSIKLLFRYIFIIKIVRIITLR